MEAAVDSHFHIWTLKTHPWLQDAREKETPPGFLNFAPVAEKYTNKDHLSDLVGSGLQVVKGVFLQAKWEAKGADPVGETEWAQSIADTSSTGMPQAIIGYADIDQGWDRTSEQLRRHLPNGNFRGLRFMLDWHETLPGLRQTTRGDWMQDDKFLQGMAALEAIPGMVFDLQVCQCQLREAAEFVHRFPGLKFSLNHAGFPLGGGRDAALLAEWTEGMTALASSRNAYCKIGALCNYDEMLGLGAWTPSAVQLYTSKCLEIFGPERCMWESNLPVDKLVGNPVARTAAFLEALQPLGQVDKERVLRGTAEEVYRI